MSANLYVLKLEVFPAFGDERPKLQNPVQMGMHSAKPGNHQVGKGRMVVVFAALSFTSSIHENLSRNPFARERIKIFVNPWNRPTVLGFANLLGRVLPKQVDKRILADRASSVVRKRMGEARKCN